MNFFRLTFLLPIFAAGLQAQADTSIAQGGLWHAPYKTTMQVSLVPVTKDLEKDCLRFRRLTFADDGSLNFPSSERYDQIRQLPQADSMEKTFAAIFKLGEGQNSEFSAEVPTRKFKWPFYKGSSHSVAVLDVGSVSGLQSTFREDSFSAVSAALKLPALPIRLIYVNGNPTFRVEGRDAVCDILAKKITLTAQAFVQVSLPLEEQILLNQFYSQVERQVLDVLARNESHTAKVARLGVRLSQLISPSTSAENTEAEEGMLNLFRALFKENSLELSSVWGRFSGRPSLSVSGSSVRAPVRVEFSN